jgi:hypothetical protein
MENTITQLNTLLEQEQTLRLQAELLVKYGEAKTDE